MLASIWPSWLSKEKEEPQTEADSNSDVADESTPKAHPVTPSLDVPSFTLSGDDAETNSSTDPSPTTHEVPMFPAANSAQRADRIAPANEQRSKPSVSGPASLMLPPSLSTGNPRGLTATNAPRGPLPNRGPPANSQQRVNGGLSPNGVAGASKGRGKVLLKPGHSPMDWAALIRSGNLSGVDTFQRVTPIQLKAMTGRKGKPAWSSWQGKVYNITPYLPFHPGGEPELMKAAGRDGTKLFMDVHPWVNWENMLGPCLVGVLVPENYASSSLEDMD
ncbi:uncharacterized protein K489DRAFT_311428 [Dissoconium aciculare CBS 342.82]|uniref:Cytochrome b5 heme-binding domain-containing protein n=1 Tax=Dissoconium aciculare CBS 342.82 TaxID=1314786 RepID=A0A6J3MHH2_9PEZI|nr:uncharacterized protein K489DRAFT_311428 [Dissoconium aciculare CBS 342.82]KAF1827139.1 hypothetical protein K489DRAFT_311428 [Dissoconium aciculare CBS 342.82]